MGTGGTWECHLPPGTPNVSRIPKVQPKSHLRPPNPSRVPQNPPWDPQKSPRPTLKSPQGPSLTHPGSPKIPPDSPQNPSGTPKPHLGPPKSPLGPHRSSKFTLKSIGDPPKSTQRLQFPLGTPKIPQIHSKIYLRMLQTPLGTPKSPKFHLGPPTITLGFSRLTWDSPNPIQDHPNSPKYHPKFTLGAPNSTWESQIHPQTP